MANTHESREKGLMHARPLHEDEAALFVFPSSSRYAFWNKNVSFPLSLAFCNEHGQVVDIKDLEAQSTQPVAPSREARFVIEVAQGAFERRDIRCGDTIRYENNTLSLHKANNRRSG